MNPLDSNPLKPLAGLDGEPVFDEPWQAEALALADTLTQQGLFSAGQWSAALGRCLAAAEARQAPDDQNTYYQCVLEALEDLLQEYGGIDGSTMRAKRDEWEAAYRSTPHGQPVRLESERGSE